MSPSSSETIYHETDMDIDVNTRYGNISRSSNGCWTCRLRRKKCDEKHPVCDACASLHITCHYDQDKPEWMDGGTRQEEMAERIKGEVKEKAHRRRGERATHLASDKVTGEQVMVPQAVDTTIPTYNPNASPESHNNRMKFCPDLSAPKLPRGADCTLISKDNHIAFGRSDTTFLMFYLENLFPFLFPFYRPSILQGGRAWILEMIISSPVVRQAILCQSSYFFSLTQESSSHSETAVMKTKHAFEMLRQSLQVINGSSLREHLHGAVRIMASIMQVQRFEIAALSFENCRAHLNAALALFEQLLDIQDAGSEGSRVSFDIVTGWLGPPSWESPAKCVQLPSAEQAALHFSSALLILDDIIASTVIQERPRLYQYHSGLLDSAGGIEPSVNLEATIGCQNWVLRHIGEIATLDAWKQQCKKAESLNVMELVHRATAIKDSLETHLAQLEIEPAPVPDERSSLLYLFTADCQQSSRIATSQTPLVTRVWAHAALIYLFVVVSGWQPASVDVRYHVGRIIDLLMHQISPPALLRTMVWPFCVAGCLAEPEQEASLRRMAEGLRPPSVWGTVRKALEIMEHVWRNRNVADFANLDLASCLRSQGELVLLV